MARQRKKLSINKDKLKKTSAVESTTDTAQNREIVRPINPVVNYPNIGSKGGNGSNVNFTRFYGKGYDDITNRVYYTAKALLKNTDALSEETQKGYFKNGFFHFAEYLTLSRYSAGEDLTQDDITPELIEQYLLHLRGCELGYNTLKGYYTHLKSMLIEVVN